MVFSSIVFLLVFLPAFLILYTLADKRYKNGLILLASILFYSWGAPRFVFVILGSTFLDFYVVRALHRSPEERRRKLFLGISIFLNLGLLLYFKYANFFVENVNAAFGRLGMDQMEWMEVALPIGISFYTFQTLTYSIDIYRRVHAPLDRVSDYMLYIMSFPQMIAGPIVRFSSIADQLTSRPDLVEDKLIGFYRFGIGLAKKVLIANVMAEQADLIFNRDIESMDSTLAWIGITAYTFQIYFDFSGYSDMAIGLGRMMGFRFPENFDSPYTSKSISEFWRRWHITLGTFMRDYLYIPLGGNRVSSKARLYANLWIVFLLSGLWHGASWSFVVWGAFHGLFLILDRLFLLKVLNRMGSVLSTLFTFLVVMVGWVFFRVEEIPDALSVIVKMFSFDFQTGHITVVGFYFYLVIACVFAFLVAFRPARIWESFMFNRDNYTSRQHIALTVMTAILFFLSVSSIAASGFNPFIYFRF